MKFDMSKAWNDAVAMLGGNRELLAVVAGLFFFLPYLALTLYVAEPTAALEAQAAQIEDPTAIFEMLTGFYSDIAWIIIVMGLVQAVGTLSLLVLLTDHARPTVGQAIQRGLVALLPYIGVQLLQVVVFLLVLGIPTSIALLIELPAILGLLLPLAMVVMVYVMVKFSLVTACIVVERNNNPLAVLQRSWTLTKGNSFRLFGFYLLLVIALAVFSMIVGLVAAVLGMIGGGIGSILTATVNSGLNMIATLVMAAVLAAVHAQLSGQDYDSVSETFE